jgi:hypothetical protein
MDESKRNVTGNYDFVDANLKKWTLCSALREISGKHPAS